MIGNRETVDIETAGATVALDTHRNDVMGLYVDGAGEADYAIDVTDDLDNDWLEAVDTITGATFSYGGFEAARYVRVRVTSGTGTVDDTADVLVTATGR